MWGIKTMVSLKGGIDDIIELRTMMPPINIQKAVHTYISASLTKEQESV